MQHTEYSLTYVREDKTAALTCPSCGRWRIISADPFRGAKHKLRVRCSCNKVFKVFLEFRRKVRRKTYLRGTSINQSQKGSLSDIVVLDVSTIGLTFSSFDASSVRVDDKLSLRFILDDRQESEIAREAVVRNVRQRSVGCEFETTGGTYDGPLGFYMMS